jgi:hypothetical protein
VIRVRAANSQTIIAIAQALTREPRPTRERALLAFDSDCKPVREVRSFRGAMREPKIAHIRVQAPDATRYLTKYFDPYDAPPDEARP